MAKQGMKREERTHNKPHNEQAAVPEIQGKAKHRHEKPIPEVYKEIDTDLARDNLENDIPDADLQDL